MSKNNANQPRIIQIMNYLTERYELRVNEVTQKIEGRKKKSREAFEEINESDLMYELYEAGFTRFKDEFKTLFSSSKIKRYDPFLEYFNSLPAWKETDPDHITELADYVKTDNQEWWKWMFKKHLVRMAGQATGLVSFNKHCLTLVGNQNDGKTSFWDFITPPALSQYQRKGFTFGHKEGLMSLIQNFVINLDELASFEKKELNNDFKSVISESSVRYRPLFANYETTIQRRASFVATTNKMEFLTDETGNVRWIPFIVKSVNHDFGGPKGYNQKVDINKVWAQAYTLLKTTFSHHLTPEEIEQQERANKHFQTITDEMDVVLRFIKPSKKGAKCTEFMSPTEIGEYFRTKTSTRLYSNQLGRALTALGFDRVTDYCPEKGSRKGYFVQKITENAYLLT
jgi:predicted P-loop ATPase